ESREEAGVDRRRLVANKRTRSWPSFDKLRMTHWGAHLRTLMSCRSFDKLRMTHWGAHLRTLMSCRSFDELRMTRGFARWCPSSHVGAHHHTWGLGFECWAFLDVE